MNENRSKLPDEKCPYWNPEGTQECGMTKGGMYIPMPEHVTMFCLSWRYSKCRQYIRGCELTMSQDDILLSDFLGSKDRRRLRRFPEQVYLDLVVCNRNNGPQIMHAYKAKSLDVSLGGLRIETSKEFTTDTIVSFGMDPDFSSDRLLGVGEIKWCESLKDSNKFECGISFSNYSSSESMREYLGM